MEFIIPDKPRDLELPRPGVFHIKGRIDVPNTDVDTLLETLSDRLLNEEDISQAVLDNDIYDKIYSLVDAWTILSNTQRTRLLEVLSSAVTDLVSFARNPCLPGGMRFVFTDARDAAKVASRIRNALKALLFIYTAALVVAEKNSAPKPNSVDALNGMVAGGRKKGGKGGAAGKAKGKAAKEAMEDEEESGGDDDAGGGEEALDGDDAGGSFDWPARRAEAVSVLCRALTGLDYTTREAHKRIWASGNPEEGYLLLFLSAISRIVVNPTALKDKDLRATATELVAAIVYYLARCPTGLDNGVAVVVSWLMDHDHTGAFVADLLQCWAVAPASGADAGGAGAAASGGAVTSRFPCPPAATELLVELGRRGGSGADGGAAASGPVRDSRSPRRAADFLIDVSGRLPALVVAHTAVLMPYIDAESYTLRSALVTTLSNVVSQLFSAGAVQRAQTAFAREKAAYDATVAAAAAAGSGGAAGEGGDGEAGEGGAAGGAGAHAGGVAVPLPLQSNVREALLDVLQARIHDVNAFVRAAALKGWSTLVVSVAVPLPRYPVVAGLVVGRLRDKAAKVRQTAARLLRTMMEVNPFSQVLSAAQLAAKAVPHTNWLRANAPSLLPAKARGGAGAAAAAGRGGVAEAEDVLQAEMSAAAGGGAAVAVPAEARDHQWARDRWLIAAKFAAHLAAAVPVFGGELLSSRVGSDVMEAIRFLSQARAFGVPDAGVALAGMLQLVWSKQETGGGAGRKAGSGPRTVREEVIDTFDKLYLLNEALEEEEEADDGAGGEGGEEGAKPEGEEGEGAPPAEDDAAADTQEAAPAAAGKPKRGRGAASKKMADDEDEGDDGEDDSEAEGATKKGAKGKGKAAPPPKSPSARKRGGAAAPAPAAAAPTGSSAAALAASEAERAARRASVDPAIVAQNLVSLLAGSPSVSTRMSVEEAVGEVTRRGLLPPGVPHQLWSLVAAGLLAMHRARMAVGLGLGTLPGAVSGGGAASSSSDAPEPEPLAIAARIAAARDAAYAALDTARSAMALLSFIAAAKPELVDSVACLGRLLAVLQPAKIPGLPDEGPATLVVGSRILHGRCGLSLPMTGAILDVAVCRGDYRLAQGAADMLRHLGGTSPLAPQPVSPIAAAAAAAAGPAPAPAAAAPAARGKKGAAGGAAAASSSGAAAAAEATGEDAALRATALERVFAALRSVLVGEWDGGGDLGSVHWFGAAQSALDAVFALHPRPAEFAGDVVRTLMAQALLVRASSEGGAGEGAAALRTSISRCRLGRLYFVAGHVAMKTLIHADAVAVRTKITRVAAAEKAAATAAKDKAAGGKGGKAEAGSLEDQLGVTAVEDEKELELLASIADRELVTPPALSDTKRLTRTLLGACIPLMMSTVRGYLAHASARAAAAAPEGEGATGAATSTWTDPDESVVEAALLSLCKASVVSFEVCEACLPILFTVLGKAPSPRIRCTAVTALADITTRFPNSVEPFTPALYARLRDRDPTVRKCTLLALSHLILNGMVKVKGQVGEVAVCVVDADPTIAAAAKTFFHELSKRGGNPIYNILPDTLSSLSRMAHDTEAGLPAQAPALPSGTGEGAMKAEPGAKPDGGVGGEEDGGAPEVQVAGAAMEDDETAGGGAASSSSGAMEDDEEDDSEADDEEEGAAAEEDEGASRGDALNPFDKNAFREVVRFLLGFVGKDKQSDSLAEKMLNRFSSSTPGAGSIVAAAGSSSSAVALPDVSRVWRDAAFCLAHLPLTERLVRRMAEALPSYKKALADDDVWSSVQSVLNKAKKGGVIASSSGGAGAAAAGGAKGKKGAAAAAAAAEGAAEGAAAAAAAPVPLSGKDLKEVLADWEAALTAARSGAVEEDTFQAKTAAAARRARALAAAEGLDTAAIAERVVAAAAANLEAAKAASEAEKKQRGGRKGAAAAAAPPSAAAAGLASPAGRGAAAAQPPKRTPSKPGFAASDSEEEDVRPAGGKGKGAAKPAPAKGGLRRPARPVSSDEDEDSDDSDGGAKRKGGKKVKK